MLKDNYCWRVSNPLSRTAVLIDVADGEQALTAHRTAEQVDGCELVAVLSTHYHGDHTGGNAYIASECKDVHIIGSKLEDGRVPAATREVDDGEQIELPGFVFTALHTPCHTRGHVCFYTQADVRHVAHTSPTSSASAGVTGSSERWHGVQAPPQRCSDGTVPSGMYPGAVFTGDTLFAGGCGRFFEGSPEQMLASLRRLSSLPAQTLVYCGHEYTVANLQFGKHAEPSNDAIARRLQACEQLQLSGAPTVPSTLEVELLTNVFLRTIEATVSTSEVVQAHKSAFGTMVGEARVLAALRQAKNSFR